MTGRSRHLLACLFLFAVPWLVYGRTAGFDFVPFDDDECVYQNAHVLGGLSWEGIRWAWTDYLTGEGVGGYWMPLTALSHMLVVELFGSGPAAHHLVNVLLHAGNAVLFYALLLRLAPGTNQTACFIGALLFCVHPAHVESVAWITERTDVLAGAFFLLSLHLWLAYVRVPRLSRYLGALGLYVLGSCAKPTLVPFPLVLLLLDWWPLRRLTAVAGGRPSGRVILEKLPFFAVALAVSAITLFAHTGDASAATLQGLPFGARLANAIVGYATYLRILVWPRCLTALYPLQLSQPWGAVSLAAAVLLFVSIAVLRLRRTRPWLAMAWLWFLVVLVPVIGLVQVGSQAYADRFLYLAVLGIDCAFAIELSIGLERWRNPRVLLAAVAALALGLAIQAWWQVGTWRDGETLFRRMLACTSNNAIAHLKLADVLRERGDLTTAREHYEAARTILPSMPFPSLGLASIAIEQNDFPRARAELELLLRDHPDLPGAHHDLGLILLRTGSPAAAEEHFRAALALDPLARDSRGMLASVLAMSGRGNEADREYLELVRLFPADPVVLNGRAGFLVAQGRMNEALEVLDEVLRLDPGNAMASQLARRAREGGR